MKPPFRRSPLTPSDAIWSPSAPGPLLPARRDAGHTTLPTPLDLLDGVEVNELESESVFDRFFGGPLAAHPPAPPKR